MESKNLFLVIAGLALVIACSALALGWMKVAEDAGAEVQRCEARQRKRVADIPRITIGIDITYRDKPIVSVADLRNLDAPGIKIDVLFEILDKERRKTCDASHICLDNLLVLETVAEIDSRIVNRIVRTAWAAGFDIVMAPPRNNTW